MSPIFDIMRDIVEPTGHILKEHYGLRAQKFTMELEMEYIVTFKELEIVQQLNSSYRVPYQPPKIFVNTQVDLKNHLIYLSKKNLRRMTTFLFIVS